MVAEKSNYLPINAIHLSLSKILCLSGANLKGEL
jgi:hypothetical protein